MPNLIERLDPNSNIASGGAISPDEAPSKGQMKVYTSMILKNLLQDQADMALPSMNQTLLHNSFNTGFAQILKDYKHQSLLPLLADNLFQLGQHGFVHLLSDAEGNLQELNRV